MTSAARKPAKLKPGPHMSRLTWLATIATSSPNRAKLTQAHAMITDLDADLAFLASARRGQRPLRDTVTSLARLVTYLNGAVLGHPREEQIGRLKELGLLTPAGAGDAAGVNTNRAHCFAEIVHAVGDNAGQACIYLQGLGVSREELRTLMDATRAERAARRE